MAEKKSAKHGIVRPHIGGKDMMAKLPMPAISKLFGGKGKLKGDNGKGKDPTGDFKADQHGLHGAPHKAPRKTRKK